MSPKRPERYTEKAQYRTDQQERSIHGAMIYGFACKHVRRKGNSPITGMLGNVVRKVARQSCTSKPLRVRLDLPVGVRRLCKTVLRSDSGRQRTQPCSVPSSTL